MHAARTLLLLLVFMASCRSRVAGYPRDWYAMGSFSAIPNVGIAAGAGKVISQTEKYDWSAEGQFFWQPIDDKDIADDGFADHSDVFAVRAGFKHTLSPGHKRHATVRYGFQYYRVTGEPGIVEFAGDFFGAYGGIGFETDLDRHWTMGPELSVAVMDGPHGSVEVVPTFFWHLIYNW